MHIASPRRLDWGAAALVVPVAALLFLFTMGIYAILSFFTADTAGLVVMTIGVWAGVGIIVLLAVARIVSVVVTALVALSSLVSTRRRSR